MDHELRPHDLPPGAMLERLMEYHDLIRQNFPFVLTTRRLFLLILAYRRPVGVPEVREAVRSSTGSAYHDALRRLVHGTECYKVLSEMRYRGALRHERKERRAFFSLEPDARQALERSVGQVVLHAWRTDVVNQ